MDEDLPDNPSITGMHTIIFAGRLEELNRVLFRQFKESSEGKQLRDDVTYPFVLGTLIREKATSLIGNAHEITKDDLPQIMERAFTEAISLLRSGERKGFQGLEEYITTLFPSGDVNPWHPTVAKAYQSSISCVENLFDEITSDPELIGDQPDTNNSAVIIKTVFKKMGGHGRAPIIDGARAVEKIQLEARRLVVRAAAKQDMELSEEAQGNIANIVLETLMQMPEMVQQEFVAPLSESLAEKRAHAEEQLKLEVFGMESEEPRQLIERIEKFTQQRARTIVANMEKK